MQKVFCLNSGGCGSKYIVELLKANGVANCFHELAPDFNRLGVEVYAGRTTLKRARIAFGGTRDKVYFESSNRLFSLAPVLRELYPGVGFIHLYRDARDSVRSIRSNPNISNLLRTNPRFIALAKPTSDTDENDLARVCLYWRNVNRRILDDTAEAPRLILSFADLIAGTVDRLELFLGRTLLVRSIARVNAKSVHQERAPPFEQWPTHEQETLWRICGKTMAMLESHDV